jgi:prevent-host-death family protein
MSKSWQLQDAKNKFSNLVEKAQREGPQVVTKHGKESVVVLSVRDYQRLTRPKIDLISFLRQSPLAASGLVIVRDKTFARDMKL